MRPPSTPAWCWPALLLMLLATGVVRGQELLERGTDLADRPITDVRIVGVAAPEESLVRNNVRAAVGDPYDPQTVRDDVNRIFRLGKFRFVTAEAELVADGSVRVIYTLVVQPLIQEVQIVGNKAISDQDLLATVRLVRGVARDDYLIEKAQRDMQALYRRKGYFLTQVSIDESELDERGLLIFNVIEGPRVRVKAIEFQGATAFDARALRAEIKTRTHLLLLRPGVLDDEVLASDVAALDRFYRSHGYLDVRVDRSVELSPDNSEVKVVFHISEGRQIVLRAIRAERLGEPGAPPTVFSPEQISALLVIRPGDVYTQELVTESVRRLQEAYGMLGYLDARVDYDETRQPEGTVDLLLQVAEGRLYRVGLIRVNGNFLTKDKVIRRLVRLKPGRPFDATQLAESERRIRRSQLFSAVRLTPQAEDPAEPGYRDLLIEVKERNTGSFNFGVAIGSDAGVFGDFSLNQTNFDITDVPESIQELLSGRAFRGAGQRFSLSFRPGDELFQYAVSLTEPHLLETDYSLSTSASWRQRRFDQYDEERTTGSLSLSRQLGDVWQAGARTRFQRVKLTDIDSDAPVDVFEDAGPDDLTSFGVTLTRTTVGTITRPGEGSRLEMSLDRAGLLGGDHDFFTLEADYTVFITLAEDFLGRKSVLRLNSRLGYIFGDRAPTYERFYLGGRSFRGFEFRTVSPKGIRADTLEQGNDPVGGDWLVFLGAQYEFPLFQETVTGVVFTDSGTVLDDVGFEDYRWSAGLGVRLYIPQLGPVPIAFDFGFPIRDVEGDDSQVLSFSAELPF